MITLGKNTLLHAANRERDASIVRLRANGLTYRQIGSRFGISGTRAKAICMRLGAGDQCAKAADKKAAILSKVEFDTNGGCWIFQWAADRRGYGNIRPPGSRAKIGAHRYAWMAFRGPIPAGMHVLHKCDVTACCNPDHLFIGSHSDNMKDMAAKGRAYRSLGINRADADFKVATVKAAKQLLSSGLSGRAVSHQLGLSEACVSSIKNGRSWGYL